MDSTEGCSSQATGGVTMSEIVLSLDLVPVAVTGFAVTFCACMAGLFCAGYRDNWLQHAGMFGLGLASALKIVQLLERGFVTHETTLLAVSVAFFGCGVAVKVWQHRVPKPRARAKRRTYIG